MATIREEDTREADFYGPKASPGMPTEWNWFWDERKKRLICPKCDYKAFNGIHAVKEHMAFHFPMLFSVVPNTIVLGGDCYSSYRYTVPAEGMSLDDALEACIELLAD